MRGRFYLDYFLLLLLPAACIEPYNPPEISNNNNYLVVQGYLDAMSGSSYIELSRTVPLASEGSPEPVSDASVVLEEENGGRSLFLEVKPGLYYLSGVSVNYSRKYRLKINDGSDEYFSDFVEVTNSPPIESITWRVQDNKVKIHVNTQNVQIGTRYYLWRYSETWEYNSAFRSFFKYENGQIVFRDSPDEIYYCWRTDPSTFIKIGTSQGLESDVIRDYLVREIDLSAKQFQTRYSIQVLQFSITRDEYEYWSQVRDNTQGTGSLFDTQPSRVSGNIRDSNGKPAIGFFSASSFQEKRIFINNEDLPLRQIVNDYAKCLEDTLLLAEIPEFDGSKIIVNELIEVIRTDPRSPPIEIFLGYTMASSFCVDCRTAGGTTNRPDFWD